jgi:hypothetical protein
MEILWNEELAVYRKAHSKTPEAGSDYLATLALLGKIATALSVPKRSTGLSLLFRKTRQSFLPYFARRFPSISVASFARGEILDFSADHLLLGAFSDFSAFAFGDKKIGLMRLVSAFRYLITLQDTLGL